MIKIAKKCPACGRNSLDYDPVFKKFICVWVDCFYSEDPEEGEDLISNEELRHILEYVCGYIANCDNLPDNNGYYKESIKKMCHDLEKKRPKM